MSHEDLSQQDIFTIDGVRYVAKDVSLDDGCDKCAFKRYRLCPAPFCVPTARNDGRSVIFVRDEEKKHVRCAPPTPPKEEMKPNFHVVWGGTHKLFEVAVYNAKAGEKIQHEAELPPFNSTCLKGFLFSTLEAAQETCAKMNKSIKFHLKKAI